MRRHVKTGQAVRQFIKEELLPAMRIRLDNPTYAFSFHDLRATFVTEHGGRDDSD